MDSKTIDNLIKLPLRHQPLQYKIKKIPLHALTVRTGHCIETSTDYNIDCLSDNFTSIATWQYTLKGRGRINIKNDYYDLLPGSLMLITIPGPYTYFLPDDSQSWEFIFIVMTGREAVRINKLIEQRIGNVIEINSCQKTISLLYKIVSNTFSGKINNAFTNSSYTYQICMSLLRESNLSKTKSREYIFHNLIKYLKKNIQKKIAVDEMASFMNLSYSHFTRLFTMEMGINPSVYFMNMKLKYATYLLLQNHYSIKEIAFHCGFNDVSYFCHLFKKRFGISPKKYRENEILPRHNRHADIEKESHM